MNLTRKERIVRKIVSWLVALLYERVEVHQAPGATSDGPELGVSNHFGGFADPLLLIYAMDRVPRFVARDVIWKVPVAKQLMNWLGAIPVHKREDKGPRNATPDMFRSTYDAFHEDDLVVIFPEGITVDDPSIASIKTGAARIALGARAAGVEDLEVIPAGIHYDDKASLRSKVFVNIGAGMDVDAWFESYDGDDPATSDNRDAVRRLTDDIEDRLRRTAPNFGDWQEAKALSLAAEVAVRNASDTAVEVSYGERQRVAALLSRADDVPKQAVIDAVEVYERDLDAFGIGDRAMYHYQQRERGVFWYLVRTAIIGLVLLPFALIGLLINIIPMVLMWAVGRLRMAPAVFATVKPMSAILFFGLTWGYSVWSVWTSLGYQAGLIQILLLPFYLFALIAWAERVAAFFRVLRSWRGVRKSRSVEVEIAAHRSAVVSAVAEAL